MKPRIFYLLLLSVLGLLPALRVAHSARPATAPTSTAVATDPALEAKLADIDTRADKIQDFTANFEQKKYTALLRKPLLSGGVVRVQGAIVRWDTARPEPQVLFSDSKEVRMYYPKQKLLEIYPIDERMSDLAASPLPRLGTLRHSFAIERIPFAEIKVDAPDLVDGPDQVPLRLKPVNAFLKEHVREVRVLLDARTATMLCVTTVDSDGDRTVIRFNDVRLNTGLKPADVQLTAPADVKISHPLEAAGGGSK